MATYGKAHSSPESVGFGQLTVIQFSLITISANMVNTGAYATQGVPTNFKCFKIAAVMPAGTYAGTASFNVVVGYSAESGVGTKDTPLQLGQQLLAVDQPLNLVGGTMQVFQTAVPDAIITPNYPITVRVSSSSNASGFLIVNLLGKFEDPNPTKPLYVNGQLTF